VGSDPAAPSGRPSPDAVLAVVRRAVATVLEADPAEVAGSSRLREDLGADSLALAEVVEVLETLLPTAGVEGVRVEDEEIDGLRTADDVVDLVVQRLEEQR
jgi:acyl carrier protein